jgi:hypothetical protein
MPLRVLLLVNSEPLRELVSVCLSGCEITLASWPTEVPAKLALGPYSLVIVTNFGVSPWEAVRVVPEHRDYPVLFLTGHVDDDIRAACATKHIPCRLVLSRVTTYGGSSAWRSMTWGCEAG